MWVGHDTCVCDSAVSGVDPDVQASPPVQGDLNKLLRYMRKLPEKESLFLKVRCWDFLDSLPIAGAS